MFKDLMNDRVTIRTADGRTYQDVPASVQRNRIYTERADIPIQPGDEVVRQTAAGIEEVFVVNDPGFRRGMADFPDTYQMHVHRADPAQRKRTTPSYKTTDTSDRLENSLWYKVRSQGLNLRSRPDADSPRIVILVEGQLVKKIAEVSDSPKWWRVEAIVADNAIDGFVAHRYLSPLSLGEMAEEILSRVQCGVFCVKPDGFLTPIRIDDGHERGPVATLAEEKVM